MEKFVTELKKLLTFKDTTDIGDIVLIAAKEPQMLVYAKVTDIERDPSRKDEWWNVHLSVLSIPVQSMVWTLRTAQMTGMEIFTMGGEERFVKAVDFKEDRQTFQAIETSRDKPAGKLAGKTSALKRVK